MRLASGGSTDQATFLNGLLLQILLHEATSQRKNKNNPIAVL
jgi:hypothetical protein